MCSRYELNVNPRSMVGRFGLPDAPPPTTAEVRPTDHAPVIDAAPGEITASPGPRRSRLLRWGLPASWDGKPLINARAETLEQKKTFRPLLENRCLVPATAYFEWRRDGRLRLRNRIAPAAGGIMAFAGLVDGDNFTIITCAPAAAIAHIHNRMPVVLDTGAEERWLDPRLPYGAVAALLVPCADGHLDAHEEAPPNAQPDLFGH